MRNQTLTLCALILLVLSACTSTPPPIPTATPLLTATLTATPIPADEVFAQAIYHRLDVDDTIPREGREATISMFMGRSTLLFPENQGLVLVFEVPTVPSSQEETTKAAVMLIGTAVGVAEEQGVPLSGVEVIFYAGTEAYLGFRAEPPWSVQDILAAPLTDELIDTIEQKEGAATVTPTPTATATPLPTY